MLMFLTDQDWLNLETCNGWPDMSSETGAKGGLGPNYTEESLSFGATGWPDESSFRSSPGPNGPDQSLSAYKRLPDTPPEHSLSSSKFPQSKPLTQAFGLKP